MLRRALLFLVLALAGCTGSPPAAGPPGAHAMGPVFLCHGSWPDGPALWADDLRDRLRERGIEGLVVPYIAIAGFGTGAPAERIAGFQRELRWHHARTDCRAPLRLCGVGYSSGTQVLAEAAAAGARFERCWFAGSAVSMWNAVLGDALRQERIEGLVNWFSPLDLIVWVKFGAGIYGYHGAGYQRVFNRVHFWPHMMPLWRRDAAVEELVDELCARAETSKGVSHTCFEDRAYRAWYEEARERLRVEW